MAPLRAAVLGLGQRGLQHLRALWQLQTEGAVRIVALADARPENLEAEKLRGFVPGEELMRTTRLNALYVCIPPGFHAGEAVEAARCGLHVFVEKPMSLYLDEAIAMEMAIEAKSYPPRYRPRSRRRLGLRSLRRPAPLGSPGRRC